MRSITKDLDGYDLEECKNCEGTGNLTNNAKDTKEMNKHGF